MKKRKFKYLIPENCVLLEEKEKHFSVDLEKIPITRGSGVKLVYIRESYKILYSKLENSLLRENENRNITFSGNSGIGKSLFYVYCLKELIKRNFLTDHVLLLHSGSRCMEYMNLKKVIRLIDPPVFGTELFGWKGFSIIFASPDLDGLREFKKGSRMNFFMPPWTLEEILECNKECRLGMRRNVFVQRFDEIGGIARYLFDLNMYQTAHTELNNFMGRDAISNLLDILKAISKGASTKDEYSHRILVMIPSTDYLNYSLGFASKNICRREILQGKETRIA
jgi:hypothetical protein